jgi:hypothetical protein
MRIGAETKRAHAVEDHEHLLIHMMIVKRPSLLARRDDDKAAAKLLHADQRPELAELGGKGLVMALVGERDVGDVTDRVHRLPQHLQALTLHYP